MLYPLIAVAAFLAPAPSEQIGLLEWKFEKGKSFYQTMTTTMEQTLGVVGNTVTSKQNETWGFKWTALKQDEKKNWLLTQRIEAVRMELDIGGNKMSYDSQKPAGAAPKAFAAAINPLVGAEFTVTLSPEMEIIAFDVPAALIKRIGAVDPKMQPFVNHILGDDGIKQMAATSFGSLPNRRNKNEAPRRSRSYRRT
jgi:hypothetical protein